MSLVTMLASMAALILQPASPPVGQWRSLSLEADSGQVYEARFWTPPEGRASGCSVLMIGGGSVTDMHWTIAGSFTIEGVTRQATIDGEPTRDADTIAEALVRRGFAVMQWSSIHRDDPMYGKNPARAMGIAFHKSVALTRLALEALKEQPGVDPQRIVLVGHSLGAARAAQVADDGIAAMAFLAGAYLSRMADRPSAAVMEIWGDLGVEPGDDMTLDRASFEAWAAAPDLAGFDIGAAVKRRPFAELDRDGDGILRAWELAGAARVVALERGDQSVLDARPRFQHTLQWPIDVLTSRPTPVLALFAGLDQMSMHGPLLEHAQLAHVEVAYIPNVNHQFARSQDQRTGPIDAAVVERLAEWLAGRCPGPP